MSKELKLMAIGDPESQKTYFLLVLSRQPLPERYVPAICENFIREEQVAGVSYKFRVWDTFCTDEHDRLRPLSLSGANVILLCFALDSKQTFCHLTDHWVGEAKHYCPDGKIIVIGTQLDLREEGNPNHVSDDEARGFVTEQKCDAFIPVSAKTGEGMDKVLPMAVKVCKSSNKEKCQVY
jgi:small GTP-binding protein